MDARKARMAALLASSLAVGTTLAAGPPETTELTLGFIKLTDMAPLAIAYEKGYFEDEELDVYLEPQANWDHLLQAVADGTLDGAQMLPGQALAARFGYGFAEGHIVVPLSLDRNGNAITVSNEVWQAMKPHVPKDDTGKPIHPVSAEAMSPVIRDYASEGKTFKFAMVSPVSTHNYELRYWLAAGGIHPGLYDPTKPDAKARAGWLDGDVRISVTPPPQMPKLMERGGLDGYCVGEPWNQQAVEDGTGVPVVTDNEIWKNNPEKVFGMGVDFVEQNPNTTTRLLKALLRAAKWLDENNNANRMEAVDILSMPDYVGASPDVIANSMTGTFEYEKGDKRKAPDFNIFFREFATYPFFSDAVWYLTQMRRWGQIPEPRTDDWYIDMAKDIYRPDLYAIAANELIANGEMSAADFPDFSSESGFRAPHSDFIDGVEFDGSAPNDYLRKLPIGLSD